MKKIHFLICFFILISGLSLARAGRSYGWHFLIGPTYINGFSEVTDIYYDNIKKEGYNLETTTEIPIGLSFQSYYQLKNGFRLGAGFGPIMAIVVTGDTDKDFSEIPFNLNLGYTLLPTANFSPYIRAGVTYPIVSGTYIEDSSPGTFGAVGIEFLKKKIINFGAELGYDRSTIKIIKKQTYYQTIEEIENIGLTLTIFARY